jgi:hypothetical protein
MINKNMVDNKTDDIEMGELGLPMVEGDEEIMPLQLFFDVKRLK